MTASSAFWVVADSRAAALAGSSPMPARTWSRRSRPRATRCPPGEGAGLVEVFDEGAELADVAAFADGVAERLVAGDHRVAAVPGGGGLGVQPEHVAGPLGDGLERALTGVVVVGAGVAEDDHGGAPAHLFTPDIPEG